jgi:hypothetical protein
MKQPKKDFWKDIWDSKGRGSNNDLLFLDGYDHLDMSFDSGQIVSKLLEKIAIKKKES